MCHGEGVLLFGAGDTTGILRGDSMSIFFGIQLGGKTTQEPLRRKELVATSCWGKSAAEAADFQQFTEVFSLWKRTL